MIAIVPARYSSVRLPGKLLLPIDGRPLILHTVDRARKAATVSRVIVATDDQRIFDVVTHAGIEAVMTSPDHSSGTDRLAEVAEGLPEDSIIVNVQGDEPLIAPETIDTAVNALLSDDNADMSTTFEPIESLGQLLNFNAVKVVVGDNGYAIHFSRSPMPFPREASLRHGGDPNVAINEEPELLSIFKKHTGLYVYRRDYLLRVSRLPATTLERVEMLEQLRALEDGAKIRVVEAVSSSIGVDTQEDYEKVCRIVESRKIGIRSATSDDVPQIAQVHVESWQESFRGVAPENYLNSLSVDLRRKVFADRLSEPSYRLLVADEHERGVVGFIDFGTPNFENYGYDARVYSFYLLPEYQRRGLGARLFETCRRAMKDAGYGSMCLDTLEMSPYRKFYEKHGGRVVAHDCHKLGDTEYATVVYGWEI
ncbi:MAG TPA: 3-deoxy-manno-octulosonate cytidylyltransferase [Pyrinomonadaceae bacterium]|nr:3-deoxy-manno-octulosonate cytidylyltransferase [Pyrinomonadaceae bacterium]